MNAPRAHDDEDDGFFDVEPTLASIVRAWRVGSVKLSLRRLAKVSGVSLAQLSRIESGQVTRPSIETLWALAPAINCHPTLLLVLAGHLRGDQAREALRDILENATPAVIKSAPDDGAET